MLAMIEKPKGARTELRTEVVCGMKVLTVTPAKLRRISRQEAMLKALSLRLRQLGVRSYIPAEGAPDLPELDKLSRGRLKAELAPEILRHYAPPESVIALRAERFSALTARTLTALITSFRSVLLCLDRTPPGLGSRLMDNFGAAVVIAPGQGRLSSADFGVILAGSLSSIIDRSGHELEGYGFDCTVDLAPPEELDYETFLAALVDGGVLTRSELRLKFSEKA